jgi:hypothetical protein
MKILIACLLFINILSAEIKVGEQFPVLTLVDQYNHAIEIRTKGKITLLLSFEKKVSTQIQQYLETKGKDFLDTNNLMYISDISGMPSFVTRMFALPKMKSFSFKIALIYDENEAKFLSRENKKVSLVTLENNRIKTIKFVEPKDLDAVLNN